MTERADYAFAVKEHGPDNPPWIMFEPQGEGLSDWKGKAVGLVLPPETTMAQAEELARVLNASVTGASVTDVPR